VKKSCAAPIQTVALSGLDAAGNRPCLARDSIMKRSNNLDISGRDVERASKRVARLTENPLGALRQSSGRTAKCLICNVCHPIVMSRPALSDAEGTMNGVFTQSVASHDFSLSFPGFRKQDNFGRNIVGRYEGGFRSIPVTHCGMSRPRFRRLPATRGLQTRQFRGHSFTCGPNRSSTRATTKLSSYSMSAGVSY
jgi:hypothetical protein